MAIGQLQEVTVIPAVKTAHCGFVLIAFLFGPAHNERKAQSTPIFPGSLRSCGGAGQAAWITVVGHSRPAHPGNASGWKCRCAPLGQA